MRIAALAALVVALLAPRTAMAQSPAPQARVILRPPMARLGEPVTYRVEVIGGFWRKVAWLPPDTSSAFTWGEPRRGNSRGRQFEGTRFGNRARSGTIQTPTPDTSWIEIPLQVFELGVIPIPGMRFRYLPPGAPPTAVTVSAAPTVRLVVVPTLTAADSNATLRGMHGPLRAPWWERVPWMLVSAIALFVLCLVSLFLWWRARRKRPDAGTAPEPILSPTALALRSLEELRRLGLPAQARFAEHAFRLGQILRRFLEATVATTRPGDSTPELVGHLREAGLSADDLGRLSGLLRAWDRVKFAREPMTAEEALRTEAAVEVFVRRQALAAGAEAA